VIDAQSKVHGCRWSAPTASETDAKPSRSRQASSSRFMRGTSAGPSYTSAVYSSISDAPAIERFR